MYEFDTSPLYYYSQLDEDHFFGWLQEIPCVNSIERGVIRIDSDVLSEVDLRDLLAIFYRYGLPMSSLSHFETDENRSWFRDPRKYWYERVFGDA